MAIEYIEFRSGANGKETKGKAKARRVLTSILKRLAAGLAFQQTALICAWKDV